MYIRFFLIFLLVWLVYTGARSAYFLHTSQGLFTASSQLPHQYSVGDLNNPVKKYLVLGDSTAAGTGASSLETSYPYLIAQAIAQKGYLVNVQVLAKSGARLSDVLNDQLAALPSHFDYLTVSVGANDATHFTNYSDYSNQLSSLITDFKKHPEATILMATPPDMSYTPALPAPYRQIVGMRCAQELTLLQQATSQTSVKIVDWYKDGALKSGQQPDLYATDRFHPSSVGYAQWANLFINRL